MTQTWQPGTTYVPGSIVQPNTASAPVPAVLTNGNFETGDLTGWTVVSGTWTVIAGGYSGTYKANVAGTGVNQIRSQYFQVTPGASVSAACVATLFNAGTDDQAAGAVLVWYDASHGMLSFTAGHTTTGVGGSWKQLTVSGVAPANSAYVALVLSANNGTHGGQVGFDAATINAPLQGAPAGLLYKATQAAPGKSGATEPVWPGNTTTSVTDNQVTWQGVIATQLVWTASPINRSGGTEPTWPTQPGGSVNDNGIDWIATVPVVTDKNWPSSKITAIVASKIYKADKDIVRYSATVNPLDWSSTNDAGYLPFGLNTYGDNPAAAMAIYRSNLVVFSASGFQMWQVDEDPANTTLMDALPIASTWATAITPVANDLIFLSSEGVRSVGISATGVNLQAGDVGMPIDPLVQDAIDQALASGSTVNVVSTFIAAKGQYWLAFSNYPVPLGISGTLGNAAIDHAENFTYTIGGGTPPYVTSISSGALPAGLSLSSSGTITGTRTLQGSYSWTVKLTDANGGVLYHNDSSTTAAMTLTGTLPGGAIGDTVMMSYTAGAGHAPYTYAVVSGTLPPGVSLASDGTISGTYSGVGSYSFTVRATDAYGNTADDPQTVVVTLPALKGRWLLTNTVDTGSAWLSSDPGSWPSSPYALSSANPLGFFGGDWDGAGLALTGAVTNATKAINILNQGIASPLTAVQQDGIIGGIQIKAVGGILFKYNDQSPVTITGYSYSTDHGQTWTQVSTTSADMRGIARLNSGRWMAFFQWNSALNLMYSDQAIPTAWTLIGPVGGAGTTLLMSDGATGLFVNSNNDFYTTTDGFNWTRHAGAAPTAYGTINQVGRALGPNTFLIPGHEGSGLFYITRDAGATWETHSRQSLTVEGTLYGCTSHGNTVALCWSSGLSNNPGLDVSYDLGVTWSAAPLPWAASAGKNVICNYLS